MGFVRKKYLNFLLGIFLLGAGCLGCKNDCLQDIWQGQNGNYSVKETLLMIGSVQSQNRVGDIQPMQVALGNSTAEDFAEGQNVYMSDSLPFCSLGNVSVQEDEVRDVCVFQFDGSGKLAYKHYYQELFQNDSFGKMVRIFLRTDVGAGAVYVLANVGDITADEHFALGSMTTERFEQSVHTAALGNGMVLENVLPMSGKTETLVDYTNLPERIEVQLTRMVAKVILNLNVLTSHFKCHSVVLKNVPENLEFFPQAGNSLQAKFQKYLPLHEEVSGKSKIYTWYLPENKRGQGTVDLSLENPWIQRDEAHAPKHATYIQIIGSYYSEADRKEYEVLYYIYLHTNLQNTRGNKDNANNFDVLRNNSYVVDANIFTANEEDGRVMRIRDLSASGLANCYITWEPYQWYKIDGTIRGNGAMTEAAISPTGKALEKNDRIFPKSAELIWETVGHKQVIDQIEFPDEGNGFVYFKTGAAKEGNAVICVKGEDDNILWSWHIWHTHFSLEKMNEQCTQTYLTNPRNISGFFKPKQRELVMMDRNLGAASNRPAKDARVMETFGLLYQWGRKDPFMHLKQGVAEAVEFYDKDGARIDHQKQQGKNYATVSSSAWAKTEQSLKFAIEHPQTFIWGNSNTGDWIYNTSATIKKRMVCGEVLL